MSYREIIRAWQDEEHRTERALLPENPIGLIELADEDLDTAVGGIDWVYYDPFRMYCAQSGGRWLPGTTGGKICLKYPP